MRRNLIVFGAGASYGSDASGTPPLGAGLFAELARFNPDGWGAIPYSQGAAFNADFEKAMAGIAPHALGPLQRAMAAYFFQFAPLTSNLYFSLAQRIAAAKGWDGALVTLNYERLLEISLLGAGVQPFIGDPPAAEQTVELCLPHGACHIFCDAVTGTAGGVSFDGFGIETDGPISIVADPAAHRRRVMTDALPPVMSYFEPAKRTTTGASFIRMQRERFRALVQAAEVVVIIGVHPRTHDAHIWDALAATSARIVYCGGQAGASAYNQWCSTVRSGERDEVLPRCFRDEFANILAAVGL